MFGDKNSFDKRIGPHVPTTSFYTEIWTFKKALTEKWNGIPGIEDLYKDVQLKVFKIKNTLIQRSDGSGSFSLINATMIMI